MKLQTSRLWLRIGATIMAALYGIAGTFALMMSTQAPNADLAARSTWMGVTFLIAAVLSFVVTWLVDDLSNIWCIPAKKSPQTRLPAITVAPITDAPITGAPTDTSRQTRSQTRSHQT